MPRKTLKIVSESAARKIQRAAATNPDLALRVMKYDGGKYKWHGSARHYYGHEIQSVPQGVHAIFVVRRRDQDGEYAQFFCVTE